jgi:hypothetical protein
VVSIQIGQKLFCQLRLHALSGPQHFVMGYPRKHRSAGIANAFQLGGDNLTEIDPRAFASGDPKHNFANA